MAEEGLGPPPQHTVQPGSSSGLAILLTSEDSRAHSQKNHLISYCDDIGFQSIERTLEHIFSLPYKSITTPLGEIDTGFVCSILRIQIQNLYLRSSLGDSDREGVLIIGNGCDLNLVGIDESSLCGDVRVVQQPLLIESLAIFSSIRANACVWKGKWMYEAILETAGIQQLGWATVSCPFNDHKGVGDADDSYAYDGRRIRKWNKEAEAYGQSWVAGDVIGCCIDLDFDEISFYRNGVSLGVAFDRIRKLGPKVGYYPAISLSQGERCDLNFGGRPFKHPIDGFHPVQALPTFGNGVMEGLAPQIATYLLQCFLRLVRLQTTDKAASTSVERLTRLKRFAPLEELFLPISRGICQEFFSSLDKKPGCAEYIGWGPLMSFLLELFGLQAPHNYSSLDRVLDLFLEFPGSRPMLQHVIQALSCSCKTASLVLTECPYSGSYPYLALACHILRREELMIKWWKSSEFEFLFEGFLSRKVPNKQDLQCMVPSVWWPGSCEDMSSESSMMLTTTALSGSVSKIEEMHREFCRLVIQFIPPIMPPQLPGSVFRTFLQNLILKNRGADRNHPPPGISSNSVLVSLYTVILHFLSEGFGMGYEWIKGVGTKSGVDEGFLHRGGQQSFPISLFLKADPLRIDFSRLGGSFNHLLKSHPVNNEETEVVRWEEGCMDDEDTRVTHSTRQKPCCCSNSETDFARIVKDPIKCIIKGSRGHFNSIPQRSAHVSAECSAGSLDDEIVDKPSSSDQSESDFEYQPMQHLRSVPRESNLSSATLREEELLDAMLLLYHLGLAPNFKQASYYMSHQSQSISLLDETDKQIRERSCNEHLKRLKEARNVYREELIDCVRQCTWFRISLFSRWKQRGMYATCMWIVQLLLVLSKVDLVFSYIPEFYLEALVESFHALRRSDPPFVSSAIFIQQGLSSFVTFVVTHFNDPRISSADLRDVLLQSISVLLQYKDYLVAFENNEAAIQRMPSALLAAFDNRSWIPVTNIFLRLCKGSGFGLLKHGESSSTVFQGLLREACICDEGLFSAFLNRLFNTLSWTITEFSISIREMQENYPVPELHQRKCAIIFDLSCNLARVLEFVTCEIPQAFLVGPEMNLRRLTELIVFILNNMTLAADTEFFDLALRRQGQLLEKINRAMILAPLVGMIINLADLKEDLGHAKQNDIVEVFASMECSMTVDFGFQYLLDYNWGGMLRGDGSLMKLRQLERFSVCLRSRTERREPRCIGAKDEESCCCICYGGEADAQFVPCHHRSCTGCIMRHLLNSQRCFFCNATVLEVLKVVENDGTKDELN